MSSEIVPALITVGGVVVTAAVTYGISRQNLKDLRTNIARELDIIAKLNPDSAEATKLSDHVRTSIYELVARDERKPNESLWIFAPLSVSSFVVYGLGALRQHGVSKFWQPLLTTGYWMFVVFALFFAVQAVVYYYRLARSSARLLWSRYRLWSSTRSLTKDLDRYEAESAAMREWSKEVRRIFNPQKEKIIQKGGQQLWDEFESLINEIDAHTAEMDKRFEESRRLLKEGPGRDSRDV